MSSPKHLAHKPIISVNDYDKIDAEFAGQTDVVALSIGEAQWDNDQISLKIWRHTGEKWSRQSEEMPIHRNLDLSILFIASLLTDTSVPFSESVLREVVDDDKKVALIQSYYKKNKKNIDARLKELKRMLNKLKI